MIIIPCWGLHSRNPLVKICKTQYGPTNLLTGKVLEMLTHLKRFKALQTCFHFYSIVVSLTLFFGHTPFRIEEEKH